MRKLIGYKDGKEVFGVFNHNVGELPTLKIAGKELRGSNLGPANYMCKPDKADVGYWQSLAKGLNLID